MGRINTPFKDYDLHKFWTGILDQIKFRPKKEIFNVYRSTTTIGTSHPAHCISASFLFLSWERALT